MNQLKSPITTHVLDTAKGQPAAGVAVQLRQQDSSGAWRTIGSGRTDVDGRIVNLTNEPLQLTRYCITFATKEYFSAQATQSFYPSVSIEFQVDHTDQHYHVPLLLSPFGYSTYRGS